MKMQKFDIAAIQAIVAFISFILFAVSGNFPAMILSLALFVTAMDLANEVAL